MTSSPSIRVRGRTFSDDELKASAEPLESIEPWLATILRAEHVSALFGSGLSIAVSSLAGTNGAGMNSEIPEIRDKAKVEARAKENAKLVGRAEPNIEDKVRTLLELKAGLQVLQDGESEKVEAALNEMLKSFYEGILTAESELRDAYSGGAPASDALECLIDLLLAVTSRPASRERAHVFTTNYDRLIEWSADQAGLRTMDRFVGALEPVFRSSRVDVDMHYSPPGIRGEPRYLDGVFRLTKLHGSLDWRASKGSVTRMPLGFGTSAETLAATVGENDHVLIYPRPAKDVETSEYPYSELLRDFSAAVCRPNSSLFTYGYGFGDDHINRVIADMLAVSSTHLVIVSFDDAGGRIGKWIEQTNRLSQISWLIGPEFATLDKLVSTYLPNPPLAKLASEQHKLLDSRGNAPAVATASEKNGVDEQQG